MTYPLPPFQIHRPASIQEVTDALASYPDAKLMAGGTDLMVNMRRRIAEPEHLISLAAVAEMRGIQEEKDALVIGAMTTLEDLATHPQVEKFLPLLAQAAGLVAGPTLRAMGTLGGNILLDTRCRYYNQSYFWRQSNDFCLKKDGEVCHVAPGGKFCWAAFSGDTPAALLVLGAEVEITGQAGAQWVALADVYGSDGRWPVGGAAGGLEKGKVLTRVRIPKSVGTWHATYEKLRVRESIDFPLAGIALAMRMEQGAVAEIRVGLTGLNPRPVLLDGLDDLAGRKPDLALISELAKKANRAAKPMRTTTADPAYRRAMVTALVERAAARLTPELSQALEAQARWA